MKKTEKTILIISIIAIFLNFFLVPGGSVLTVMSLSLLAIIYFCFGITLFTNIRLADLFKTESLKDITTTKIFGVVALGFTLSITVLGILFKLLSWPGAAFNLGVGVIGLIIIITIGAIKYSNNKSKFYLLIFKRAFFFGGIGLLLLLTPKSTFIDLKYRNHISYANALKNSIADPTNEDLRKTLIEERTKMEQSQ